MMSKGLRYTLCCMIFFCFFPLHAKELVAVIDLSSNVTITAEKMNLIYQKINIEIAKDSSCDTFPCITIPIVLDMAEKQGAFPCYDAICFSRLGSEFIGATQLITGTILLRKGKINVRLFRYDVITGQKVKTVSDSTEQREDVFFSSILPVLVRELLQPPVPLADELQKKEPVITPVPLANELPKKKPAITPVLIGGTIATGVAVVVYTVLRFMPGKGPGNTDDELPLGNVPEHTK